MCCGCIQRWCADCCAWLVALNALWSNYVIFACGVVVTALGVNIAYNERNLLSFVVLILGILTLLTAYFGIWLARQTERRPCCVSLYSCLLLLLIVPQLAGALMLTNHSFVDTVVSKSCTQFERTIHRDGLVRDAACSDQNACSASDKCLCECDEKCRSCQRDVEKSREFIAKHAKLCSYLFFGFGGLELFAWISVQMLRDGGGGSGGVQPAGQFELDDHTKRETTADKNELLRAMKAKYADRRKGRDDPEAGTGLLVGDDDEDQIFHI